MCYIKVQLGDDAMVLWLCGWKFSLSKL